MKLLLAFNWYHVTINTTTVINSFSLIITAISLLKSAEKLSSSVTI